MDAATLYLYISMGLNMVLYLIVGMYLIKRAIDKKIYSMVYFAILLILISLCFVAYIIAGGASELFFLLRTSGMFMGYIFVKKTFYEDKKLRFSFKLIIVLSIIIIVVTALLYTVFRITDIREFKITSDIIFGIYMIILGIWQFFASKSAYENIKNYNLEPYIKKRYQIFAFGAIIFSLSGIFGGITGIPPRSMLTVYLFSIMSTFNLIYLIITYLVWVMPNFFKNYLNKGYSSKEEIIESILSEKDLEELSEEELMAKIMEES